jgi:hypothetical protein
MSSIIQELLIVSSNTKRRHGSRSCSSMSSIMKELLIVSSITKRRHMEVTTEISISYNSKASSMFSQECVGGPKNGSSKSACRASRLYTEQVFTVSEQQVGLESRKTAIKLYRSAQQNKTKECNGAHYELCQSQE